MPIRPREINDQITDSRLREVIRYMVNQEVTRLVKSTSSPLTGGGSGPSTGGITETVLARTGQVWTVTVPEPPSVTSWDATGYVPGDGFNTYTFDSSLFDPADPVFALGSPTWEYDQSTTTLSLDWGSSKTGYVSLLNLGTLGYVAIAVAET